MGKITLHEKEVQAAERLGIALAESFTANAKDMLNKHKADFAADAIINAAWRTYITKRAASTRITKKAFEKKLLEALQ